LALSPALHGWATEEENKRKSALQTILPKMMEVEGFEFVSGFKRL
jgi:hypothetical protein